MQKRIHVIKADDNYVVRDVVPPDELKLDVHETNIFSVAVDDTETDKAARRRVRAEARRKRIFFVAGLD